MRCLLVIDVQKGFVSERTKHVVPKIEQLMQSFREDVIIATKFINLDDSPYVNFINWSRLKSSPETDLVVSVEDSACQVFEKNIYSSCTPEMMTFLRKNNITEVYVVGIDTDCCVLKTATDLFENNIRPIVLIDYCASNGGEESHKAAIKVMERTIGKKQIVFGEFS